MLVCFSVVIWQRSGRISIVCWFSCDYTYWCWWRFYTLLVVNRKQHGPQTCLRRLCEGPAEEDLHWRVFVLHSVFVEVLKDETIPRAVFHYWRIIWLKRFRWCEDCETVPLYGEWVWLRDSCALACGRSRLRYLYWSLQSCCRSDWLGRSGFRRFEGFISFGGRFCRCWSRRRFLHLFGD